MTQCLTMLKIFLDQFLLFSFLPQCTPLTYQFNVRRQTSGHNELPAHNPVVIFSLFFIYLFIYFWLRQAKSKIKQRFPYLLGLFPGYWNLAPSGHH